jgi:hypothetical protein
MSDFEFTPPPPADAAYPAVRLLRRHGDWVVGGFAVIPVLAGLWANLALGGVAWLIGGLVLGAVTGFLMRCFVELVRIIADMLLPR